MMSFADGVMDRLWVHPRGPAIQVCFLSGGNQQKLVIGKWMSAAASVYVIVEPTNGIDIGAIKEAYDIILHLARDGAAVVLVSSSLHEILALSDRVWSFMMASWLPRQRRERGHPMNCLL